LHDVYIDIIAMNSYSCATVSLYLLVQVNNEWCEPNPTIVEDSTSSDAMLVHRPAVSSRQPSQCTDGLLEQHAGDSRHDSAAAMLESASLSSYNAASPQLSGASVSHTSNVQS